MSDQEESFVQVQLPFETRIMTMLENLQTDVQSMKDKVNSIETQSVENEMQNANQDQSQSEQDQPQSGNDAMTVHSTPKPTNWADRDPNEKIDYSFNPTWPENEEDEEDLKTGTKLFKVSENTEFFLRQSFTSTAPNAQRWQWRDKAGAPHTPFTACPSPNKLIKTRLLVSTKARDTTLAKQQLLLLDAVGPITHILEEASKGQLTLKSTIEAAQIPLKLLGNAYMHLNRERML